MTDPVLSTDETAGRSQPPRQTMVNRLSEVFISIDNLDRLSDEEKNKLLLSSHFNDITDEEILEVATTGFKYFEVGMLIEFLGPERLEPFIPQFLEFLQDVNWPAARGVRNMLARVSKKEAIVPPIKRVLVDYLEDGMWMYWLLQCLVVDFPRDWVADLCEPLVGVVEAADEDGAANFALAIVAKNSLLPEFQVDRLYHQLEERYEEKEGLLEELYEEVRPFLNSRGKMDEAVGVPVE